MSDINSKSKAEWVRVDYVGTNLREEMYFLLKQCGEPISEDKAKEIIYTEFGFDKSLIQLVNDVASYEKNINTHQLRVAEKYNRVPMYISTDYNYIRFDVRGWQYEMINGELVSYCN